MMCVTGIKRSHMAMGKSMVKASWRVSSLVYDGTLYGMVSMSMGRCGWRAEIQIWISPFTNWTIMGFLWHRFVKILLLFTLQSYDQD